MKNYKILLISFILLFLMIGVASAASVEEDSIGDDGGFIPFVPVIDIDLDDPGSFTPDEPVIVDDGDDEGENTPTVDTKEIYVNSTGDDSNLGTEKSPYATVSKAVSDVNASNDATIYIGEGTFLLEGSVVHYYEDWGDGDIEEWDEEVNGMGINLNHELYGGNLKFIGAGADKTFLDGQSMYYFASIGATSNVTIKDITFINCNGFNGGAIFNQGNLNIDNCIFKDCSADQGGAIYSEGPEKMVNNGMWVTWIYVNANLTVTNSKFISCSASGGGAINERFTNLYLENNTFVNITTTNQGVAIFNGGSTQDTKSKLINNKFINLTGTQDASIYINSAGNSFAIVGNEFINCSSSSESYSTVTLMGNYIFENNTFVNSSNSVGNIYCSGSLNKMNLTMEYAVINVSNSEANKGFKLNKINATDDMGNIVRVGSIKVTLSDGENTITRNIWISNGEYRFTFSEVPKNGIYNLTLTLGDSNTDVLSLVNISLSNDPVDLWVSPEGFDGNNGTVDNPFATIQHAIDVGFDQSFTVIVHLLEGTYAKDGNVQLTIANKGDLQIIGEKYNETIIDGEGTSWFLSVSTTNVNITNLKFINGKGQRKDIINGGNKLYLYNCIMDNNVGRSDSNTYYGLVQTKFDKLVYTNNKAKINVRNCNITDSYFANNTASNGAVLSVSGVTIMNSRFINNGISSGNGGAVEGSLTSINNYYESNHGTERGGAVYVSGDSKFIGDTFENNYAANTYSLKTEGGAIYVSYSSDPSATSIASFKDCRFINNSADKGGAISLKIGKFDNCSFINNTADYGGAFYVVPYMKIVETTTNDDPGSFIPDEPVIVIEDDPIVIEDEPIIIIEDFVLGAQMLPVVPVIPDIPIVPVIPDIPIVPVIPVDIDPVEEEEKETINSLMLNNVIFENNVAKLNGNDIYLEKPANLIGDDSQYAFGVPLTITFNDLNVSSLVGDLTATVYGPCNAVIGANYLTFEFNGTKLGSSPIVNSVATFNYAGFEDGDYVLNGTVEYPNHKNIVNSALISVKLENIVDHTDVWVSANGSDENGNGSQASPFKSISKALDESVKNCRDITVYIGEGVYSADSNTLLTLSCMNNITLMGEGMDKTIIDGEGANYFARITEGNNKIVITNLTLKNMAPNVDKTINPVYVESNSTLYLDTVNITGFKYNIYGQGNIFVSNSVFSKNFGLIGSSGLLTIDNTFFTSSSGAIGGNVVINNSVIKDIVTTSEFTIISGKCIVENTLISNDCNNESLTEWGIGEGTCNPAVAVIGSDVYLNNVSIYNNFKSPVKEYQASYGAGSQLAAFGYLYGSSGKKVTVYNSTFANFKYLWCVNTYGLVEFYFDGCLFDNITMIAQSQTTNAEYTEGINSSYVISNSVFINSDPVIDRLNRGDRPHPNCTFEDNYWGDNSKAVVTYVNCPKTQAPSFEPATWVILTEEDGVPVFKVTDGENTTAYEGSLPAEISYVADENGDVIPVLNLAGTGYKLSVDENGSVVLNTAEPMKNIVPKVAVDETVFANDTTAVINDGSKFTADFTNKWGDPLKETNVSFIVGEKTISAITDAKGTATFNIDFALGQYIVSVINTVTGQSIERVIGVITHETTFASDVNATYNDGSVFSANFTDEFGSPLANTNVTFKVGNDTVNAITDVNGTASFVINQNAGSYNVTATNPVTGEAVTKSIVVSKLDTKLLAYKLTMIYNTGKYLKATLRDANGNALANQTVYIKISGKTFKRVTNGNGQVSLKILLPVKAYATTITYNGNANYAKSSASTKVVVNKATPKLTAVKKVTYKATKTKKYAVFLKDNKGKAIKKAKVYIKIGRQTYKATTTAKGKAIFKITKLTKKGKYTVKVSYLGNKNFKAVTKYVQIIVR